MALDPKDGGYKSRKLAVVAFAAILIFVGAILAAKMVGFAPAYDTMVGGIVGLVTAFLTGNIASKWVTGKAVNEAATVAAATKRLEEGAPVEEEQPEE